MHCASVFCSFYCSVIEWHDIAGDAQRCGVGTEMPDAAAFRARVDSLRQFIPAEGQPR